jgi:hypothetical protein
MTIRTIAASVLALGLLAPMAFAGNGPAGSEVNNRKADYPVVETYNSSTQGFAATPLPRVKRGPVGDFVDETPQDSNERSSNR